MKLRLFIYPIVVGVGLLSSLPVMGASSSGGGRPVSASAKLASGEGASAKGATSTPLQLKILGHMDLPSGYLIQGYEVGGISGALALNEELILVSDDKGKVKPPRAIRLQLKWEQSGSNPLKLDLVEKGTILFGKESDKTYDFEGLSQLPWGNLLVSSEGDNNRKPRQGPEIKEFKLSGEFVRNYEVPKEVIPNPTGKLKKGIRNNHGFEGLTAFGDEGNRWLLMVEQPLKQDPESEVKAYVYNSQEAWRLKLQESWTYPLEPHTRSHIKWGVSEVFWLKDEDFMVIERGVPLETPLVFDTRLFLARKEGKKLVKVKSLLTSDQEPLLALNFEAIARGPDIHGQRSIILVSDNDFRANVPTRFLVVAVKE